jgi:drug/metabolite transporter (DMT)-like permease
VEYHVFILVLVAALIHAIWNSWLKQSVDRLTSMALMGMGWMLFSLPWVFYLPLPTRASWSYLLFSTLAHVVYSLFLVTAYKKVDLSVAYPLFRGSAPLLITLSSWILLNEALSFVEVISILLITVGIFFISYQPKVFMGKILSFGILGGALIAIYTILDGQGARINESSQSYAAWLFIFSGMPLFFIGLAQPNKAMQALSLRELVTGVLLGILSCIAFCIIVWALTQSPMGLVSALRETSVLMVAIFSAVHLKEKVKWPGIFLIISGLILMRL